MIRTGILFVLLCFLPNVLRAEFRCSVEVKYRWQPAEKKEVTSFWATVEKRAETEAESKEMAQKFADIERSRAFESCVRQHQNVSGCISSKMAAYQEVMQNLAFSSRIKLEESIVADCSTAHGNCTGVDVSEPTCVDLNPPEPEETTEEDSSSKKKKKK